MIASTMVDEAFDPRNAERSQETILIDSERATELNEICESVFFAYGARQVVVFTTLEKQLTTLPKYYTQRQSERHR